jgi:hypothetical protein
MRRDDPDLAPEIKFDDAFVRGAQFKEGSAEKRRRRGEWEQRRAQKIRAKRIRRPWRPRRRLEAKDWVVPALVVVAVVYAFRLGPFRPAPRPTVENARSAAAAPTPTPAPGETTSTTLEFVLRSYSRGECVTWDPSGGGPERKLTETVPCQSRHFMEVTGSYDVSGVSSYPSPAAWSDMLRNGECNQQVNAYVRGGLDPFGRFMVGWIYPLQDAWDMGDRTVWCGVEVFDRASGPVSRPLPFTGMVNGQDQAYYDPVRTCLTDGRDGLDAVSCEMGHTYQVVGLVDATPAFTTAPTQDDPRWARLDQACTRVGAKALSGPIPTGVEMVALTFDPASWRTGRRQAECGAVRYLPGRAGSAMTPQTVTGSLLASR